MTKKKAAKSKPKPLILDHEIEGDQDVTNTVDISDDICVHILEEGVQNHQSLMLETRANEQSAHNIARHAGARKYNQEDPIEAASAEMILSGSPNPAISAPGNVVQQ